MQTAPPTVFFHQRCYLASEMRNTVLVHDDLTVGLERLATLASTGSHGCHGAPAPLPVRMRTGQRRAQFLHSHANPSETNECYVSHAAICSVDCTCAACHASGMHLNDVPRGPTAHDGPSATVCSIKSHAHQCKKLLKGSRISGGKHSLIIHRELIMSSHST